MKKLLILLIASATLIACNAPKTEVTSESNGATATTTSGTTVQKYSKNVNTIDFKKLVDSNAGVTIDVRTPQEFAGGHIDGAINLDVRNPSFKSNIAKLDKSESYLVYCRSGGRSSKAVSVMKSSGFEKTYNLSGGIMGWQKKGFSVAK